MLAGKDEWAMRASCVGEELIAHLQWQDGLRCLATVCWRIWQAWKQTNKTKNEHCILFLPLRKEIFKKEKNKDDSYFFQY